MFGSLEKEPPTPFRIKTFVGPTGPSQLDLPLWLCATPNSPRTRFRPDFDLKGPKKGARSNQVKSGATQVRGRCSEGIGARGLGLAGMAPYCGQVAGKSPNKTRAQSAPGTHFVRGISGQNVLLMALSFPCQVPPDHKHYQLTNIFKDNLCRVYLAHNSLKRSFFFRDVAVAKSLQKSAKNFSRNHWCSRGLQRSPAKICREKAHKR